MVEPEMPRGQASLDQIMFTLAVNFLMYVVLILVFYMLTRFYLEEQTTTTVPAKTSYYPNYAPVSTEEDIEYELPANSALEENEVENMKEGRRSSSIDVEEYKSTSYTLDSPTKVIAGFFNPDGSAEDEPKRDMYMKIAFCTIGLNITFLIWGLLQERILTRTYDGEFFAYSYGLVFINRLLGFFFSAFLMYYFRIKWVESPMWEYSIPSVANVLSSWCQYEALQYVSFPTQMLAKAFKMLPVMLVGKFIHNKHYDSYEYISAAAVGFGIYLFIGSSENINFKENVFGETATITGAYCGVVLLLLFLCFDSFTGQWQTRMFQIYRDMNPLQMMLISNGFSAIFSFVTLINQEQLVSALGFVYKHPEMNIHLLLFCVTSTIGQLFIYYTVKNFGALIFSIIMAIRILLSTLLSCFVYSHPITELGLIGMLVVFGAVAFRIYQNSEGKKLVMWKQEDRENLMQQWRENTDI